MTYAPDLEERIISIKNALEQGKKSLLTEQKDLAELGKSKKSYQEQIFNSKIIVALGLGGTIYSLTQIPHNFYQNKDMGVGFAFGVSVMGLAIGVLAYYSFFKMHQKIDTYLQQYQDNSQRIRELNQRLEEELRRYTPVKDVN